MTASTLHRHRSAFTLVEVLIGSAVGVIASIGVFAVINAGSMLTARNLSVNLTSNAMRKSLDRVEQVLQQSETIPVLIDTAGNTTVGPAAGVRFDRYIGGPYVIDAPAGLAANVTSIALVRSTASSASPPLPQAGDVIRISGSDLLRPRIASIVVSAPDAALHQTTSATLTDPLGTAIATPSGGQFVARLVRRQAMIVMPAGGARQLRFYPSLDTTTDLNNSSSYILVSDMVGLQADDATPFTNDTPLGINFVKMSLRVRASKFDARLLGKQGDQFNTFARVDTYIRPKVNPINQ